MTLTCHVTLLSHAQGFLCGVWYVCKGEISKRARALICLVWWKGQMYTWESVCLVLAARPLMALFDLRLLLNFNFFLLVSSICELHSGRSELGNSSPARALDA